MKLWDMIRSLVVVLGLIGLLLVGLYSDSQREKHKACCTADTCEREGHHR